MNPIATRNLGLFAAMLFATVTIGTVGCTNKDKSASDEAPYGQSAPPAPPAGGPPGGGMAAPPGPQQGPMNRMNPGVPPGSGAGSRMGGGPPPGGPMGGPPMGTPPMGGPMMGGGGGDPMAPLTPTPALDKAVDSTKASGNKKALAAALADRGFARMTDDAAGRRIKYRKALEDFREALKNDPANEKAKTNKEMIEKIYTDMGLPIPGAEVGAAPGKP